MLISLFFFSGLTCEEFQVGSRSQTRRTSSRRTDRISSSLPATSRGRAIGGAWTSVRSREDREVEEMLEVQGEQFSNRLDRLVFPPFNPSLPLWLNSRSFLSSLSPHPGRRLTQHWMLPYDVRDQFDAFDSTSRSEANFRFHRTISAASADTSSVTSVLRSGALLLEDAARVVSSCKSIYPCLGRQSTSNASR